MAEARKVNIVIDSVGVIGFDDFIEEVKSEVREIIEQSFESKESHAVHVDEIIKKVESGIRRAIGN